MEPRSASPLSCFRRINWFLTWHQVIQRDEVPRRHDLQGEDDVGEDDGHLEGGHDGGAEHGEGPAAVHAHVDEAADGEERGGVGGQRAQEVHWRHVHRQVESVERELTR